MSHTTPGIIVGFHETELVVNDPGEDRMVEEELHFSIMNPNRKQKMVFSNTREAAKSRIRLFIDIGEGEHNLFTPRDRKGYGTILCHGEFQATGWKEHETLPNRLYCDITPSENNSFILDALESIRFTWVGIASTASRGFCSVMVQFSHIEGVPDSVVSCELFKKKSDLRILQFRASPSTAAYGQTITLYWTIQKATKGRLYPGAFDIFSKEQRGASSRDIVFDEDCDSYYLNISSGDCSACRKVDLFTSLPLVSAFLIEDRQVKWEVYFASLVELSTGGAFEKVDPAGHRQLSSEWNSISLRATSADGTRQRDIHLPPVPEIIAAVKDTAIFRAHKIISVRWETEMLKSIVLKSWDTVLDTISEAPSGVWEQAYPFKMNCQFAIYYETSTGIKGSLTL